ncbi:MAG: addiction module protein [Sulfurimonadaceae bacterium]|jgi:putative addiction module component (TIGR02574 family)
MSINELLEQALTLNVNERTKLIDELFKSIDKPDEEIDQIWADEASKRLEAYRKGELKAVPMEKIFNRIK